MGESFSSYVPSSQSANILRSCEKLCGKTAIAVVRYFWEGPNEAHYVCAEHAKVAEANNSHVMVGFFPET